MTSIEKVTCFMELAKSASTVGERNKWFMHLNREIKNFKADTLKTDTILEKFNSMYGEIYHGIVYGGNNEAE